MSSTENYSEILSNIRDAGIPCESDNGSELLPLSPIKVNKYNSLNLYSSHHAINEEFLIDVGSLPL